MPCPNAGEPQANTSKEARSLSTNHQPRTINGLSRRLAHASGTLPLVEANVAVSHQHLHQVLEERQPGQEAPVQRAFGSDNRVSGERARRRVLRAPEDVLRAVLVARPRVLVAAHAGLIENSIRRCQGTAPKVRCEFLGEQPHLVPVLRAGLVLQLLERPLSLSFHARLQGSSPVAFPAPSSLYGQTAVDAFRESSWPSNRRVPITRVRRKGMDGGRSVLSTVDRRPRTASGSEPVTGILWSPSFC